MNWQGNRPYRFDIGRTGTPMTLRLIIINTLVWLGQIVWLWRFDTNLIHTLGLHYVFSDAFGLWQWLTHIFLHSPDSVRHLLFNMYALWLFGSVLERHWGAKRYLCFYLVCGVSAALLQQLVWVIEFSQLFGVVIGGASAIEPQLSQPVGVGASGAVFGLLLAFGMLFPRWELFVFPIPFPIKAKYFVLGYGLLELYLGLHPAQGDSVAYFAHIGGMIGGYILIRLWRHKGRIGRTNG